MATKKITTGTFQVSARLKLDVGLEIQAASLEEAVTKAQALTISDFIDFKTQGLDHNDSDAPDVYGIWKL